MFGRAVLSDFGEAVNGDQERNVDAQPSVYRSPEVMLKVDWSFPIDIWNVGVMVRSILDHIHSSNHDADRLTDLGSLLRPTLVLRPRSRRKGILHAGSSCRVDWNIGAPSNRSAE